jgi:hypothetical protein
MGKLNYDVKQKNDSNQPYEFQNEAKQILQ